MRPLRRRTRCKRWCPGCARGLPGIEVESHPAGYRLVIEPDAVDVARFERLVAAGRAALPGDAAKASRTLREALELWRGPALLDVAAGEFFRAPVARLSELKVAALEDRIEADLRLGRGRELTSELSSLVAEHPLREQLIGALMRALVAARRPAEALTVFGRAREALAEELGADPVAGTVRAAHCDPAGRAVDGHVIPRVWRQVIPHA